MINKNKNWDCDGDACTDSKSEVRVYPLGGGANLILCHSCFAHENKYRFNKAKQYKWPDDRWPQINWETAEHYPNE